MPFLTTRDNTRIFYKDWGPRTGRPVVLIHGWPLQADSFDPQAFALGEAGFRVIAYDRRGFGRSEQPWAGYDYDTLTDDLADVLTGLELEHATVAGFSMGGGEVARFMSRHRGERLAQAVLISSVVPFMLRTADNPKGTPESTFDTMTEGMKADRPHFMKGFIRDFYGVGILSQPVSDELLHWAWLMAMQASLQSTLSCARAFATTDFRPDLASFSVPTLVIHGARDQTVPIDASGRAAARGIAGAELIEYDDAPHGLLATHKDRVTADLLAFLRKMPTPR